MTQWLTANCCVINVIELMFSLQVLLNRRELYEDRLICICRHIKDGIINELSSANENCYRRNSQGVEFEWGRGWLNCHPTCRVGSAGP